MRYTAKPMRYWHTLCCDTGPLGRNRAPRRWGYTGKEERTDTSSTHRNTAAGLIIATQNFGDPNVLVMLALANMLGLIMLLGIARVLSRDNKVKTVPV